jgi:hypothetical protein
LRSAIPYGASLYSYYACGELKAEGSSVAEGIGQGRITANLEGAPVDAQFRISDAAGHGAWVHRLLEEEGLCLGLSSGINVAGAIALAREMGPGKTHCDDPVRHRIPVSIDALQCANGSNPRDWSFRLRSRRTESRHSTKRFRWAILHDVMAGSQDTDRHERLQRVRIGDDRLGGRFPAS